jgi:hypothetical protein
MQRRIVHDIPATRFGSREQRSELVIHCPVTIVSRRKAFHNQDTARDLIFDQARLGDPARLRMRGLAAILEEAVQCPRRQHDIPEDGERRFQQPEIIEH